MKTGKGREKSKTKTVYYIIANRYPRLNEFGVIFAGIESVSVDMNDHKLTLIGDMDPVVVVGKLRKLCVTEILSIGPAKEEKKNEPEKDEKKTEEKKDDKKENLEGIVKVCEAFEAYHQMRQPHYYCTSLEENPNACVIC